MHDRQRGAARQRHAHWQALGRDTLAHSKSNAAAESATSAPALLNQSSPLTYRAAAAAALLRRRRSATGFLPRTHTCGAMARWFATPTAKSGSRTWPSTAPHSGRDSESGDTPPRSKVPRERHKRSVHVHEIQVRPAGTGCDPVQDGCVPAHGDVWHTRQCTGPHFSMLSRNARRLFFTLKSVYARSTRIETGLR